MDEDTLPLRRRLAEGRWEEVPVLRYKADPEAPYRDVTRQILFDRPALGCQLRYFEVQPGGFSTLERHRHEHAVVVLRGSGHCLVGTAVYAVAPHDLISVPGLAWHQFRAGADEPLGFLCMVNAERDRPQMPAEADLADLRRNPQVRAFLGG